MKDFTMQTFEFKNTKIPDVVQVTPFCADDVRGYFIKDYAKEIFENHGIFHELKEVFYTYSHTGVIRGLHFQRNFQQPKLVRCVWGKVFDVVVDLRKNSPAFKQWLGFELSEENKQEILVPAGCAHGYLVLQESVVAYKCAEKFYGEYDDGIMWNDSEINVQWPLEIVDHKIILADKDKNLQSFSEFMETYGGF